MRIAIPRIIQGGMGAGVSDWSLAQAVSRLGQLGVVSGTALDQIMSRRLQNGDPGGHVRRALALFPFPEMTRRILNAHFIPGGKKHSQPYRRLPMHTIEEHRESRELCIASNFVEITLARENHSNPVGINYLEKIQLPHLASIYGAMLAGVAVVIVGAGIPLDVPVVMAALANHEPAYYPIHVQGAQPNSTQRMAFNPRDYWENTTELSALPIPDFLPIVSSETLAKMLARRAAGTVAGFIIERHIAGGHNAPPRGPMNLTADGQPIYGQRDIADTTAFLELGLPFWLAGGYGTRERFQEAVAAGASGVQVGTAFALCAESALISNVRRDIIRMILDGNSRVFTDPRASPTGFPFKVAHVPGTLSEPDLYAKRVRVCDLGYLREPYMRGDQTVGYRCPSEPEAVFISKGGKMDQTINRKCLCNALMANIGMPQLLSDESTEGCLVTLGDETACICRLCSKDNPEYHAADVVRELLA